MSNVNHPSHYGGADNPYEAIKVIETHGLGFNLGNALKYLLRAGKKGDIAEDLQKATWYLLREAAIAKGLDPSYYTDDLADIFSTERVDLPQVVLPQIKQPVELVPRIQDIPMKGTR